MVKIKNLQIIGSTVAIIWEDGAESYFTSEQLRAVSPSAEQKQRLRKAIDSPLAVTVLGWHFIGNYAVRFSFSDGHQTGIYSYSLLRQLIPDN